MLCQLGAQVYQKNYSTFGTQVGPLLFNTPVSYTCTVVDKYIKTIVIWRFLVDLKQ